MPPEVLEAMIGHAVFNERHLFALSLLVGFWGLLRTGELLGLEKRHFSVTSRSNSVLVSLGYTKGGKRHGAAESVKISVEDVTRRVQQWIEDPTSSKQLTPAPHVWRKLFNETLDASGFSELCFRPYSLRRGGATFLFRQQGSLDRLMIHGRWHAVKTARIYLNEGMAFLASLAVPWKNFSKTLRNQYLNSLKHPLPMLEPMRSRAGGVGKKDRRLKNKSRKKDMRCVISRGLAGCTGYPRYRRLGLT